MLEAIPAGCRFGHLPNREGDQNGQREGESPNGGGGVAGVGKQGRGKEKEDKGEGKKKEKREKIRACLAISMCGVDRLYVCRRAKDLARPPQRTDLVIAAP